MNSHSRQQLVVDLISTMTIGANAFAVVFQPIADVLNFLLINFGVFGGNKFALTILVC